MCLTWERREWEAMCTVCRIRAALRAAQVQVLLHLPTKWLQTARPAHPAHPRPSHTAVQGYQLAPKCSVFLMKVWRIWKIDNYMDISAVFPTIYTTHVCVCGGRLVINLARMCVSKSEGYGSLSGFKRMKSMRKCHSKCVWNLLLHSIWVDNF